MNMHDLSTRNGCGPYAHSACALQGKYLACALTVSRLDKSSEAKEEKGVQSVPENAWQ